MLPPLINSHRNEELSTDNCQRSVIVTACKAEREREREPKKNKKGDWTVSLCTTSLSFWCRTLAPISSFTSFYSLTCFVLTAYRIKRLTRCIYIYMLCSSDQSSCLLCSERSLHFQLVDFHTALFFSSFSCLFMFTSLLLLLLFCLPMAVAFASQVRLPCPLIYTNVVFVLLLLSKEISWKDSPMSDTFFMHLFPMTRSKSVVRPTKKGTHALAMRRWKHLSNPFATFRITLMFVTNQKKQFWTLFLIFFFFK